ncbi:unnamed protein product [Bursaphelenchus okinawaensis]|uniref:CWH43-like N-terminal domain-containing protein n=1 Tax=Bursaphelenchus okinawaensis TaxID=465554 RepID=A0A811KEN2_9BILA|nr:unnamed protein product [Bursaphelenchus okinawaensis]CAG9100628.1 unnamed protein product [Bursaphelenchus okinawaensis]
MGVSLGHIDAFLPIISEGGALPPESCIFSSLLNYAAFCWVLTATFLHTNMKLHLQANNPGSKLVYLLYFMLGVAWVSAVGLTWVANFQISDVRFMHGHGATMTFIGDMTFLDTAIIVQEVDGVIPEKPKRKADGIDRISRNDPWFVNRLVASISEWFLGFAYIFIVGSFAADLKNYRISPEPLEKVIADVEEQLKTAVDDNTPDVANVSPAPLFKVSPVVIPEDVNNAA